MPQPVVPRTTYNSIHTGKIPSISSTRTPSFPPASISEVPDMSTTHQPTPDPSVNPPHLSANPNPSANPSAGPSTVPSAIPPTRNPQPIDATTMANTINDLVKSNLPSTVPDNQNPPVCWWVGKTNWHKTNLIVRSRRPERVHDFCLFLRALLGDCQIFATVLSQKILCNHFVCFKCALSAFMAPSETDR